MADQYEDLGITQKQDGEYWDIIVPDLDANTNYAAQFAWIYKDKEKGASDYSEFFEFTTPDPERQEVSDIVWTWDSKQTLTGTWKRTTGKQEKTYQVYLTPINQSSDLERSWTVKANLEVEQQKFILTKDMNIGNFSRIFRKQFTGKIKTTYLDGTTDGVSFTTPAYDDPICSGSIADGDWEVLSIPNGISISWKDELSKGITYKYTHAYVSESIDGPWTMYSGYSPIQIPLYDFNKRYVKIAHFSDSECESNFSSIKESKAYDPITFDTDPPDPVQSPVTAAWNTDKSLVVSYKMPAQNLPTYVKIFLTYNGTTKWFEKTITTSTANQSTSSIINRQEFIDTFGELPNSFSAGYITDMDVYRNENTTHVNISNISTIVKPNPLENKTTTITVSAAANGYVVSSNLDSKATGIKIYQSSTQNGTYALVASSISSPVIVYDDANAGSTVWVKGMWTCEDGDAIESSTVSVTILDVGALSLIENPVKIKTDGSIFAGTLDENDDPVLDHARMVINKRGLFLYDDNDSNGESPTTQIIGDWNGTTATFITQKAKIANWVVGSSKIENLLSATSGTSGTYTGLSPNGTYSFWAGSGVSGGYSLDSTEDAKFSVTPSGSVTARNIKILGGQIQVGSKFSVDTQGVIKATDAELSGIIKASSGILGSMDIGGTIKVNGSDTTVDGQLRITVTGSNGGFIEMGKVTTPVIKTGVIETVGAGIQVTNTNGNTYVQLDPKNGIYAAKGSIGGWVVETEKLRAINNEVGFYAPATITSGTTAIWAGGLINDPKFKVTYGGLLRAINAEIYGVIKSNIAEFGVFNDSNFTTLTKGWYVDEAQLRSKGTTASSRNVILDGEWGAISGANILGSIYYLTSNSTNITDLKQATTDTEGESLAAARGVDYISSSGKFRLANGNLTYDGDSLNVRTDLSASNIFLGVTSNTAADFNLDYLLGKSTTRGNSQKGAGSFKLANGMMVYDSASDVLTVNPAASSKFKLYLNVLANRDGTAGDSTLVQDADTGEITLGRAFFYAGNNYPDGKTDRSQFAGGEQGSGAFSVGDIILSRKA